MDAVTIQVLRNKITSLMEEMHYHFYRSGYSTIIRESRDFSCVILDREGRLVVAPPMFFHAPVYRHLVGRILTLYERARLDIGAKVEGAAIVEQFDATTLIPPPWSGRVDGYGNLILARA